MIRNQRVQNISLLGVTAQSITERGRREVGETQSIGSLAYKNLKLKKEEELYRSEKCFQALCVSRARSFTTSLAGPVESGLFQVGPSVGLWVGVARPQLSLTMLLGFESNSA
jgi:hypothetical protein